jgi:uncharacterized protein (DUF885 family)
VAAAASPREQINRVVDRYWDAYTQLNMQNAVDGGDARFDNRQVNSLSPQYLADSLALERGSLGEILAVPEAAVDGDTRLTYDMFKRERLLAIDGYTFPEELLPVNPFDSLPQRFAVLGSGAGSLEFASPRDYENWLGRIDDYVIWTRQAIVNMRDGERRGYSLPRVLVERLLPELANLAQDSPTNPFYSPLRSLPQALAEPERSRLAEKFRAAVRDKLLPAYGELHDFLARDYLSRARDGVALSELPLGDAWYAYRVRQQTTTALNPRQIHALGLAEVERIRGNMQRLLLATGFEGGIADYAAGLRQEPRNHYKSAEELLAAIRDLKIKLTAGAPAQFVMPPQADFEIRPTGTPSAAVWAGAAEEPPIFYRAAGMHGNGPAVLFVHTDQAALSTTYAIAPLFLGAAPGRHYQLAFQAENPTLPRFRRLGVVPAFVAGWSLYAESLGEDLGVIQEPEARFGLLLHQLEQAVGMVVDTGLHAGQWTRRQALAYVHAEMPVEDADAIALVERCIALPGQALAAPVGALRIRALRVLAEQSLGARFDVRAFHTEILKDGAMPIDLLEAKMNQWTQRPP